METNKQINPLNLFQEGKIVSGSSFIGRAELLGRLTELWVQTGGNASRSVIGLNRMGKSSLVRQFCENVKQQEPDVISVNLTLKKSSWPSLVQQIMQQITLSAEDEKRQLDPLVSELCEKTCSIALEGCSILTENTVMHNFTRLLDRMEKIGQKFLLIIDEFDGAKGCWGENASYFESLRDAAQKRGFFLIVSRRPLEVIEMESYGNSCFHNVFPEIHVTAFDPKKDMPEYYRILEENYGVVLDETEQEKTEEYTGFCPAFLAGLGSRLASAAISGDSQPTVEEIFSEQTFQTNYQKHYPEFLKRMKEDGLWDDIVRILMDISSVRTDLSKDDTFREAQINQLCCKGYLRKKQNGEYIVFSDDFAAWAKDKLFHQEEETIYQSLITAEVAIREMLKQEMPKIWAKKHPGREWEQDYLNNTFVPNTIQYFTRIPANNPRKPFSELQKYLKSARKYDSGAGVADAATIRIKLAMIAEYWEDGIKKRFNSDPYSKWESYFSIIEDIRNPLFHATITPQTHAPKNYYLLKDAKACANTIINQLA